MTEQEKQALIERLSRALNAAERGLTHYSYPTSLGEGDIISVYRTALAALTSPTVRLPESKPIHCEMDFIRKEKAKSWNEAISRCSHNIRAAGYQVEE